MASLVEKIAYTISAKSRQRKFLQFLTLLSPKPDETILDVGINTTEYSATDNYLEKFYPHPENITAVGQGDITAFQEQYRAVTSLSGDGRHLDFPDNAFDIAYSNAVIEHVGTFDDQRRFLSELFRVAKRGYLTTPNRLFPIELHTRIPLLHLLLSKKNFDTFVIKIGKPWAAGSYMSLLSEQDLRTLFSEVGITHYTLIKNRFCGFPMTFTIIWDKNFKPIA
ncbi:MAG: class I SAM-dependent methyltransferase [Candidatus Moraniibacteriota bacterium]